MQISMVLTFLQRVSERANTATTNRSKVENGSVRDIRKTVLPQFSNIQLLVLLGTWCVFPSNAPLHTFRAADSSMHKFLQLKTPPEHFFLCQLLFQHFMTQALGEIIVCKRLASGFVFTLHFNFSSAKLGPWKESLYFSKYWFCYCDCVFRVVLLCLCSDITAKKGLTCSVDSFCLFVSVA